MYGICCLVVAGSLVGVMSAGLSSESLDADASMKQLLQAADSFA
jgi:hypothetical protein